MISYLKKEDYKKIGFYSLINKFTLETYAGSGNLYQRWCSHYSGYINGNHPNFKLREAFKTTPDGWEFFAVSIEDESLSKSDIREIAFDLEQNTLDTFCGNSLFLNISTDARKCRPTGIPVSEETRRKMSESHNKHWENLPEEEKEKRRVIYRNNIAAYITDVTINGVPTKVKEKMSETRLDLFKNGYNPLKGRHHSKDRIKEMSETGKILWENLPEEEKEKRREHLKKYLPGNTHTLGRKQSRDEVEKRVAGNRGKKRDEDSKKNISEGIRAANGISFSIDGKHYNCYTDASVDYDVTVQTVINRLNSKTDRFKDWTVNHE